MDVAMKALRIDALEPLTPLWVWDGAWLPAHLIDPLLESASGLILVRFSHGISAPIDASHVVLRDPSLHESDRPSVALSAMMYAESLRTAFSSSPQPAPPAQSVTR